MAQLAAEQAEALGEEFGEPVDVVGVSTGGSIAQQLAADHPGAVRRLVLVSSACRLGPRGRELQASMAVYLRAGRLRAASAVAVGGLVLPVIAPLGRAAGWLGGPRILGDAVAVADLAATIEAEDAFDLAVLRPIGAPSLVVGGVEDRFYDRDLFRETVRLVPEAQLLLVPGRGHLTVTSDTRARAAIAGFLDYQPGPLR